MILLFLPVFNIFSKITSMLIDFEFTEDLSLRRDFLNKNGMDVYCLYVLYGLEVLIANKFNQKFPDLLSLPILKYQHKSVNGVKTIIQKPMLSNYVFLYLPKDMNVYDLKIDGSTFKILNPKNDDGKLVGYDLKYALRMLQAGGIVDMSKAIKENDRVKIVSGPLKEVEAKIIKMDPRNRNAKVVVDFMGRSTEIWLPFEYMDI